ncbi:MAG: DUF1302 family protein [Casimicrobiaceae bacterium]
MAACLVLGLQPARVRAELPLRIDSFTRAPEPVTLAAGAAGSVAAPVSRDALFDDEAKPEEKEHGPFSGWHGFVQTELAQTYASPAHLSQFLTRAEVGAQGAWGDQLKWKASARLDYNAVFDVDNFYPSDVRRDQHLNFLLRETYVDAGVGDWDFRLGRQHVVWGEMVGLFFADVVSAKDRREFILPEFDVLRIPQWAARAEYFKDDFHAELVWIPVQSYDEIGKPGAEFYPAVVAPPAGFATAYDNEQFPSRTLSHTDYGVRLSTLRNGWDVAGFYYGSMDSAPTFYREIVTVPQPAFVYQPRHDRIDQLGGTLAKDLGPAVLKAETVYTRGRSFSVTRLSDPDGVVRQDTLDWIVGLDFALPTDTRLNVQLFQRLFFDHDPDIIYSAHESGFSLLLSHKLTERLEAQALWIGSLNRTDWMFRPRLSWNVEKNWQLLLGVDVFKGPPLGYFGQFDNRDRVYSEVRFSF